VTTPAVRVSRHFDAEAARAFDAWLDPERVSRWLFATPTGANTRADIDARVGGRFCIVDRRDGVDVEHTGEYLEIERPRKLVFTFAVPKYSDEYTRVSIEITPEAHGCELVLTHTGVAPEWRERTTGGWGVLLEGLSSALEASPPSGRRSGATELRFERLLPGPIERLWAYLTESDKRAEWLASGAMELRAGGRADFVFEHAKLSPQQSLPPERFKSFDAAVRSVHRVLRVEPPRLLVLSWGDPAAPSEVRFELTPEGEQVRLVIMHSRLASEDALFDTLAGWHSHLALLNERLHQRTPPAFWALFTHAEAHYRQQR